MNIIKYREISIWIYDGLDNNDAVIQLFDTDAGCRIIYKDYGYFKNKRRYNSTFKPSEYFDSKLDEVRRHVMAIDASPSSVLDGHLIQIKIINGKEAPMHFEFGVHQVSIFEKLIYELSRELAG